MKPAVSKIAGIFTSRAGDAAFPVFHAEIRRKYKENLVLRLIWEGIVLVTLVTLKDVTAS